MNIDKLRQFCKELFILALVAIGITYIFFRFIYPTLGLSREYPLPFRIIGLFLVISYFIYKKRNKKWKDFGLRTPKNVKTVLLPFIFLLVFELILKGPILSLIYQFFDLNAPNYSAFSHVEGNTAALLYFILLSLVNGGFAEEMIFRGYLLLSIEELFSNRHIGSVIAVVLQSIIFGAFHFYQGLSGFIVTMIIGAFFGLAFLLGRNLWALIIYHGLMDTVGFVLIYNGGIEGLS